MDDDWGSPYFWTPPIYVSFYQHRWKSRIDININIVCVNKLLIIGSVHSPTMDQGPWIPQWTSWKRMCLCWSKNEFPNTREFPNNRCLMVFLEPPDFLFGDFGWFFIFVSGVGWCSISFIQKSSMRAHGTDSFEKHSSTPTWWQIHWRHSPKLPSGKLT